MLSLRQLDREIDDTVEGTTCVEEPTKVMDNVGWLRQSSARRRGFFA
ncbi:hypothetical protein SM11_pC0319 (plasmid) [Sinorhizobium meliloti SM11]|uniref:Uncharacterized protein n=1 Tax=Sinorhizobium meliloti (strain SM11) TaxID=707241 RepID=F7XCA1_SINMM|nr:hypothetical protein SM11_pC0319 [Sinorhizobium meliloti SM11]